LGRGIASNSPCFGPPVLAEQIIIIFMILFDIPYPIREKFTNKPTEQTTMSACVGGLSVISPKLPFFAS